MGNDSSGAPPTTRREDASQLAIVPSGAPAAPTVPSGETAAPTGPSGPTAAPTLRIPLSAWAEFQSAPKPTVLTPDQIRMDRLFISALKEELSESSVTDTSSCKLFLHLFKQRPLFEYVESDNAQKIASFARRVRDALNNSLIIIAKFKDAIDTCPQEYIDGVKSAATCVFLEYILFKQVPKDRIDAQVISWCEELDKTLETLPLKVISNVEMRKFFDQYTETVRRCKDEDYLKTIYGILQYIVSRGQRVYPFTFICAPSGSGKTALAYSLAADEYPIIYTLFTSNSQNVYKPFKLISMKMKEVVNADLDVITGSVEKEDRDYKLVTVDKLLEDGLKTRPLQTVHFFVQLFTDMLKMKHQKKDLTWMQIQLNLEKLLGGTMSLKDGIEVLKKLKSTYGYDVLLPFIVFIDECILFRTNSHKIKNDEAAEAVFLRSVLRILKVFVMFAGTDARTSNFITQQSLMAAYDEESMMWALVLSALPQFNVAFLEEQVTSIREKFGQNHMINSIIAFLKSVSAYENPMFIQRALDFMATISVETVSSTDFRSFLNTMICHIFDDFQNRKEAFAEFTNSQMAYMVSRRWRHEKLLVMEHVESNIHRHIAYLNCVPFENGSPHFYLQLVKGGHTQYYLRLHDLENILVVPKLTSSGDSDQETDSEEKKYDRLKESIYGARTKHIDPEKLPRLSQFIPRGIFPSFADAPLTGLTLFGVDLLSPFFVKYLQPPFQDYLHGHSLNISSFPRISSLDAVITSNFDYQSVAQGLFLETVYGAAVIAASRAGGPSGCSFPDFFPYFLKELWTVRKDGFERPVSYNYPLAIPKVDFGEHKSIFDNKSIPFLSPMAVTDWSKPAVQLMKNATEGKCRLGSFMFSTLQEKVDHAVFELNYDDYKCQDANMIEQSISQAPPRKEFNDWVKSGKLNLESIKEICLVAECKQWNRNLTIPDVERIVVDKFQKMHEVPPFEKWLTKEVESGDVEKGKIATQPKPLPDYTKWCKTFLIFTVSFTKTFNKESLSEINRLEYFLWTIEKVEESSNYALVPLPDQTSRSGDSKDVIIVPLSEVMGTDIADQIFIYDYVGSRITDQDGESASKRIRTLKVDFKIFDRSLEPLYVDLLKRTCEKDLKTIGSSLPSVEQAMTSFSDPDRWSRLIMVDGKLVGEVNVIWRTGKVDTFEPQLNVYVIYDEKSVNSGKVTLEEAIDYSTDCCKAAIKEAIQHCRQQKCTTLYASVRYGHDLTGCMLTYCGFETLELFPEQSMTVFRLDLLKK